MADVDRYITDEVIDAVHKVMAETETDFHYTCWHDEPRECWKGGYVRDWIRKDVLPTALPHLIPLIRADTLEEAATEVDRISPTALAKFSGVVIDRLVRMAEEAVGE